MSLYQKYLSNKTECKVKAAKLSEDLKKLEAIEKEFRTDLLVRMRKAVIENYFSE